MPEYRPLPENHEREFEETVSYAFTPEEGPPEYDPDEEPGPVRPADKRGLFVEGELLATCRHYWLTCRVGEDWLPVGGVAAVATPPERRRQGHVRRILAASLSEYADRGVALAALWPFEHPFYAQFGWALANRIARLEVPPEALAFAREERDDDGQFVALGADEYERLGTVLAAHNEEYTLAMDRTEEWWRVRTLSGRETDPYVYGWERDGDLRAYVVYRIDAEDTRRLSATETAWVDHEARLALLSFFADHDSQVESVRLREPDVSLLDIVPNPGQVEAEITAGPMARVVDVADALAARSYPEGADGSVVLDVDDPLVDRNDARFELSVAGGEATVERVGEGRTPDDAEPESGVHLGVGALTQLYLGYRTIEELARTGDAVVGGEEARDVLADAFPASAVFLREWF